MCEETKNIDQICAKYSFEITNRMIDDKHTPKEVLNLITKALSVLQQQGLYALGLFCMVENGTKQILDKSIEILGELKLLENSSEEDKLLQISKLSEKIHDLMFAIEVIEKTLIYARYHAKARVKESKNQGEEK
ncbi:hypothetical protein [Kosmotoga olearia]|uniref:CRISPR type III-B/RAMP module-associated protein Cmr5 n=1 Tax=Kosmotoga olearia (strain ATCC BAA-1733 / DSM 21960 / TBF 19.5.1) TaxID=521045 RepID=C5CDA0_KOSOT|nr:hypothetical protein [Kosmotoga olearia]ACR79963.1 hypothetical protein Kole_1267 [Kosmotoga olearia TBF 19.5.1]